MGKKVITGYIWSGVISRVKEWNEKRMTLINYSRTGLMCLSLIIMLMSKCVRLAHQLV